MSEATGAHRYDPDELFARARAGDEEAWRQLVENCYDKVRRAVSRKMERPLRSQFDSTDFTNDAFKSLVAKSDRYDFPNMAALTAFLMKSAHEKLIDEHRRQGRIKRDVKRVQHLGVREDGGIDEPPSSEPTPSTLAVGHETQETLLAAHDGLNRDVIELKGQGYSNEEVAERTGLSVRSVQRFLKKVSDSWSLRGGSRP